MATAGSRLLKIALLTLSVSVAVSWDNIDFEIFDLVEEVNYVNFYEILGVDQSATTAEIRRSYRKLSLQYHPDKNKADDAEDQFRRMVAVYEVLKDEERRQRYDQVLVEGLPDWRQPVFYYRRVRKMGMLEMTGLLGFILTIGQYLVAWAVYFEKRLSLEDFYASKKKKVADKNKKKSKVGVEELEEEIEEELKSLPRPQLMDLWMFRLPGFLVYLVRMSPEAVRALIELVKSRREVEEEEEEEEEEGQESTRKAKRKKVEIPEYQADLYQHLLSNQTEAEVQSAESEHKHNKKDGDWTDEELILLAKAVNKFPGGTVKRWEKIADFCGRTVEEVTVKSKKVKGGAFAMNLSSSVQGGSFSGKTKKQEWDISDSIITTTDSVASSENTEEENKPRRRNKPSKVVKTADRSLHIPDSQPVSKPAAAPPSEREAPASASGLSQDSVQGNTTESVKLKTGDTTWTQNQQVIFEWALKHTPKGVEKRWEKIADQIPGKSKEDCILRFKHLADLVKKKKTGQTSEEQS
ncbi:dnaJ homolog subfamily C member 1-like [Haliotis rufescens]|uniref:dnaJ homolog subfamily C member 1-like n=1 Tax=Haliotis rufescens TaxID=6454 RepID=UPI001EB023F9|nr:dnaJ homolog subfamily C member 1-like [Haliotis rufescens]